MTKLIVHIIFLIYHLTKKNKLSVIYRNEFEITQS